MDRVNTNKYCIKKAEYLKAKGFDVRYELQGKDFIAIVIDKERDRYAGPLTGKQFKEVKFTWHKGSIE